MNLYQKELELMASYGPKVFDDEDEDTGFEDIEEEDGDIPDSFFEEEQLDNEDDVNERNYMREEAKYRDLTEDEYLIYGLW